MPRFREAAMMVTIGAVFIHNTLSAELLQVHPITMVLWRRENRGPPFIDATDARFIRYLRTDVSAWLEQNRRNTSPDNASFLPVHKGNKKSKGGAP
jgi:hypothetical protein